MTLQELRDKVAAGVWPADFLAVDCEPLREVTTASLYAAFSGSLDAASSVHEVLLPEYMWLIRSSDEDDVRRGSCKSGQFLANIWDARTNPNEGGKHFPTWAGNPARAWLLAILDALIAKENTK